MRPRMARGRSRRRRLGNQRCNGTPLADGDTVVLVKDLKVKGSSQVIKQGTKVKGIRLQEGDHDIACKIEGSAMNLKSEFVKKA